MNSFLLFIVMVFCHIVDDYYLQGWLASAKQRSWWEKNAADPLYSKDYIWALLMHSFSWTFMIMLPLLLVQSFNPTNSWYALFVVNVFIHAITDNAKANEHAINLWGDQLIHMMQIIATILFLN